MLVFAQLRHCSWLSLIVQRRLSLAGRVRAAARRKQGRNGYGSSQVRREDIKEFLADESWVFPKFAQVKTKGLHKMFDPRRISQVDADKIKGTCSDFLGLCGLLRHWVETNVQEVPGLLLQRRSFEAACTVLDLLLMTKRCLTTADEGHRRLVAATSEYLKCHKECRSDGRQAFGKSGQAAVFLGVLFL